MMYAQILYACMQDWGTWNRNLSNHTSKGNETQGCNESDEMLLKVNSLSSENHICNWIFVFKNPSCTLIGIWCVGWGSQQGGWGGRQFARLGWEGWGCRRCMRRGREGIDVEVSPFATQVGGPWNPVVSIDYRLATVCLATFQILVGCCTCTSRKGYKSPVACWKGIILG